MSSLILRDAVLVQTAPPSFFLLSSRFFVQITEMLHGRHVTLGALLGNVHVLHKRQASRTLVWELIRATVVALKSPPQTYAQKGINIKQRKILWHVWIQRSCHILSTEIPSCIICTLVSMTVELKWRYAIWKLWFGVSLCLNVCFWPTFYAISCEKFVMFTLKLSPFSGILHCYAANKAARQQVYILWIFFENILKCISLQCFILTHFILF